MSYCRWSSMNFSCDLYIYESVHDCWTIHVAGTRYVGPLPDYPSYLNMDEYKAKHAAWEKWTEEHGTEPIDIPHAGETFNLPSPGECADQVERLISLGFTCPDHVVPELREEQSELDAKP